MITAVLLGLIAGVAVRAPERSTVREQRSRARRFFRFFRLKKVWIPLVLLAVLAGGLWIVNYKLMAYEAVLFEVGQSIRSRLDDLSDDYKKGDMEAVATYYAERFAGTELGFSGRHKSSEKDDILTEDWSAKQGAAIGRKQILDELGSYRKQLREAEKTKFKMVYLNDFTENTANILMRIQMYAHGDADHTTEDKGNFNVDLVRENGEWKIIKQELIDGTRVAGIPSKYFTDVTAQAGIDFKPGANEIFKQKHYNFAIADRAAGGVAAGDYDNDGYADLFFAGPSGGKLYRNTGKGTFEDVTERAGLGGDVARWAQGAVFADYNNDGFLDLYITKTPNTSNKLLRNNGDGTFTDVTKEAGLELATYSTTAAFGDVDNDGYLDLFVTVYGNALERSPDPPYHDRRGLPDHLYHNNGDGTFTDITEEAGVGDTGWGLGMTFVDYDNDGDLDIYIANDFGANSLYQNDGTGHFKNVSREAGAIDYGFGMCASIGDFNNDGNMDIYVSNIYSGTSWYLQHTFTHFLWVRAIDPPRTLETIKTGWEVYRNVGAFSGLSSIGKKFGAGNSLLENQGDGTFKSVGVDKAVNMAGWAWGSDFFDFDNDGNLDIHAVNGWISQTRGTDL
jgi:hypothetical protein